MEDKGTGWTFLSNHGHVLVLVAREPGVRLIELSARVGITERAARSILRDLEAAGYLTRTKEGRRNHYEVHPDGLLRHPEESTALVADLLGVFPPTAVATTHQESVHRS